MKTLLGQTLSEGRPVYMALTSVFGIGREKALELCNMVGISPKLRVFQVPNNKIIAIAQYLTASQTTSHGNIPKINHSLGMNTDFTVGLELKKQIRDNINKLVTMKAYRGFRHVLHLPTRGQRTKTNAHTTRRLKSKSNF